MAHAADTRYPSLAAFRAAGAKADLVALCVPIPFDHETAVTLADRFTGEEHLVLLESATSGPNARYSYLGFDPLWTWSWSLGEHEATIKRHGLPEERRSVRGDPIRALRSHMTGTRLESCYADGVRLGGPDVARAAGAFGFFGYDTALALEPTIGKAPPKQLGLPDAFYFLPRNFLVLDHLARRLFVTRIVELPKVDVRTDAAMERLYDEERRALAAVLKRLAAVHSPSPLVTVDDKLDYEACTASFKKDEFLAAGAHCLEEIRAGEIFQIQIGNRLSLKTEARPFDVFRHLRTLNPSPYMFYYKLGKHHVLGASPEMMVGVQDGRVTHRPIAGTRRRTWNAEKDLQMRTELVESEKERAEHVMLVDLGRNDVGRVAAPGSVTVEELMVVEEYSHVFHMVSQVSGKLAPGCDAYDALAVAFPNGTVTGAPKIRAMQIIYAKEKISREFYAGSLGMFDFQGNLKSTLLIRSIHMQDGVASTQASAGIVYDSILEQEWLETRNKMAACLTAMQNTR